MMSMRGSGNVAGSSVREFVEPEFGVMRFMSKQNSELS